MTTPPIKKNGFLKTLLSIQNNTIQMWSYTTNNESKNLFQKVVYWRLLSVFITSITVYANLHWFDNVGQIVVLLVLTLTPAHYFYEKFWNYYERTR